MKLGGLILAAGQSSRMGRDKALLEYHGSTFLNHLISLFSPRVDPLIVVLGHHADAIRPTIQQRPTVKVVINRDYKKGMLTSLQAGIRTLPSDVGAAMFTLVDHPAVEESTVDRLIEQFQAGRQALAIPCYRRQRGHPVIAARPILEEILRLPEDSSAKTVIRGHRRETAFVEMDDPGVVLDIDRPSDYDAMASSRPPVEQEK